MRVTNSLFYTNAANNYQRTMQELYNVNTQISSGLQIQNSYEDSGTYVDTMRLNYEVATLEQVKESSTKAQTYTNNADNILNQFSESLNRFKTKIIHASSEVHSSTSLNAIGDELEALKTSMIALGNTSINGEYLFSGSATATKPISSDGTYNGNDQKLEAVLGANVNLPYTLDGKDLFLGSDSDYNRVVSTNVQMFNQSKLHPDIMIEHSGVTASQEVYLTENDTIRDLVGDFDNDEVNDPNSMFYISGRKSNGDTFSSKVEMKSDEKVSELLEKIGQEFGNTPTNTVAEVRINEHGQIEVKDLKTGGQLLEMNIFGAVDRNASAGFVGDASKMSIDDLMKESNVQIIEFQTSDFKSANTASQISTRQNIFTPGEFKLGAPMTKQDGTPVESSDTLQSFMGTEISQINFTGKDNSGTQVPSDVLNIDSSTTVSELVKQIQSVYGMSTRLEDGQIYIEGGSDIDFETNKLDVQLTAISETVAEVQSFELKEKATVPGNLTVAEQDIAVAVGETPTVIATNIVAALVAAPLPLVDGNGNTITEVNSTNGKVNITYASSDKDANDIDIDNSVTSLNIGSVITETQHAAGRVTEAFATFDAMNYERRGFEKDGNTLLSNVSQMIKDTSTFAINSTKLSDVSGVRPLNGTILDFNFTNLSGEMSKGEIILQDTGSYFKIDFDNTGTYEENERIPLFNVKGVETKANDVTYQQISDVLTLALSGQHPIDKDEFNPTTGANLGPNGNIFVEYQDSLKNAKNSIDISLDDRGKLQIVDKYNSDTKIELSLFDNRSDSFVLSNSAAFSFMANDAIKIEDPTISFYDDLNKIIKSVRNGEFQMSSDNKDPRSLGLNNSITSIDHLIDHVNKSQTKIGSYSNALRQANERSELLSINVQTVRSEVIDVDLGEAYMQFNQLSNSYQAMLSTVAKINSMSLLNYM